MATRLIVEEHDGKVQVALHRDGHISAEPFGDEAPFNAVLEPQELEDLRWYLEDYLPAPYAVWEEKGIELQAQLPSWGQRLFQALFGPGMPGRDAYIAARQRGPFELWIQSTAPAFLGLPWELLNDPDHPSPLALEMVQINRTLPTPVDAAEMRSSQKLRVLMVIARPHGARDVPYQMIARPLIGRLQHVAGQVELEVLRPPTIEALRQKLEAARQAGAPYDVLHFDGHGTFGALSSASASADAQRYPATAEGYLVFESAAGQSDAITAADFAQLLNQAQIPLLVFNACRSGTVMATTGPEATVATRLLQEGAGAVVAMSYSVYAVAAAEFMAIFYEALFAGKSVAEAVADGRRQLSRNNLRPSPKGPMPLDDWMIPVHYARRAIAFPQLTAVAARSTSLEETLSRLRAQSPAQAERTIDDPLRPEGRFFGRDAAFYELERAVRHQRVVVIHGVGGTGKTELAKAFARWFQVSGGVDDPSLVMFHAFEPGLASFNLDGVLTRIGLQLIGPDFIREFSTAPARRDVVLTIMRQHRLLLVWDNFETIHSLPDPTGATPPLGEVARGEMAAFLSEVARESQSGVLMTSRASEAWLGNRVRRLEVGGLSSQDASEYANDLLSFYPDAQPRREQRAYATLLNVLGGHPLSLRLILPHLADTEPQTLVDGLSGEGALPPGFQGGTGRLESLGACIYYSFHHLGEAHRRRLPALTMFEGVADVDVLTILSSLENTLERFGNITREQWEGTLEACVETGLLSRLGMGTYRMHPALPGYLMVLWQDEADTFFEDENRVLRQVSIQAHAALGTWLNQQIQSGSAETAMAVLDLERRTFGKVIGEALELDMFVEAQMMLQPLDKFWDARGLFEEAREWVERCQERLEDEGGNATDFNTDAGALWLFMVGSQADRLRRSGDLDTAEKTYDKIRLVLEASPSESARRRLAITYHQLGIVVQDRGDLESAQDWYQQALGIFDSLDHRPSMARSYQQLGRVALNRGDLESAQDWYQQSLEILDSLGDRPGMAISYHQLGRVTQDRGDLESAQNWYQQSLEIKESLGDRPGMAHSYHQLGMVAQDRGDLESAQNWYQQSLEIEESLGNRPGMASSYHQLGMVAQHRGDLESAQDWYQQSLEIYESLGDLPHLAMSYGQLGLLAEAASRASEALDWMVRCVNLFPEFPHPATGPGPHHLARLTSELGMSELEASWQRCTGQSLPDPIRRALEV